jgi:hypothetical protein
MARNKTHHAHDRAQHESGAHLMPTAPGVFEAHFADSDSADDGAGGLRAGVAAGADQERDEKRQGDLGLQFVPEHTHDRAGQHLGEEQHQQPADSLVDNGENRRAQILVLQRLRTAHALHVFGELIVQHIDHIIMSDDAHKSPAVINNGDGKEVVLRDDAGYLFLIGIHPNRNHRWRHNTGQQPIRRRCDEQPQGSRRRAGRCH